MAAGQQKKRSSVATILRFSFHESSRGKKTKKLEATDVVLNITSHVSLEWNATQSKAVAKREQVGITWREMAPFLDSVPQLRSCLADVFSVPQENFVLENITGLLSYEVWETYLSEQEKNLLIQFLPRGVNVNHVLQALLAGENLHFGNPVSKWGASLCAGNLHPDAVVYREWQLRANRNAYFRKLKTYHTEIIEKLSKLKERWTNRQGPEKDIEEEIVRNGIAKSILSVAPKRAKIFSCAAEEQPHRKSILYADSEYMSYFKISKKLRQLVANIKHSGDGIQPKSLKCILGDIKHFNIQPYAMFEEEERKRMHEHWLQLANKDLPATFENFKELRLLADNWRKSVQHELEGMKEWMDKKDEKESRRWASLEQVDERDLEQESALDVQDAGCVQPALHFTHCHHMEGNSSLNSSQLFNPSSPDQENKLNILQSTGNHLILLPNNGYHAEKILSLNSPQEHKPSMHQERCGNTEEKATISQALPKTNGCEDAKEDFMELEHSSSTDGHHQEWIPSLCSHKRLSSVGLDERDVDKIRSVDDGPVVWQFLGSASVNTAVDVEANGKHFLSCSKGILQQGNKHPYHCPTSESQAYTSVNALPFQTPQSMEERVSQLIDMKAQMHGQDAESVALHVDNRVNMFSSYAIEDNNLLLSPIHGEGGILSSFVQEHLDGLNKSQIPFVVTNDGLMQSSQFPPQFLGQEGMMLDQNQCREKDLYLHQIPNMNMPSSGRFPSQDHFLSSGSQDSTRLQSPIIRGLPVHNWLQGGHRNRASWSGAEPTGSVGQCFGYTGSIDGSLFGVFSECNQLLSSSPYIIMNSEQFSSGVNFGSRGSPHGDGIYSCPPLINNGSSRDAAASMMNPMTWVNSHQNPGLPESLRKSYLQS